MLCNFEMEKERRKMLAFVQAGTRNGYGDVFVSPSAQHLVNKSVLIRSLDGQWKKIIKKTAVVCVHTWTAEHAFLMFVTCL